MAGRTGLPAAAAAGGARGEQVWPATETTRADTVPEGVVDAYTAGKLRDVEKVCEVAGQGSEFRVQGSVCRSRRSEVGGRKSEVRSWKSEVNLQPATSAAPPPSGRLPLLDTRHPTRLVLLRMGHLGDLIHLMPAVNEIRRQRPDWRLELITGPWNRELVESYDLFDEVHYWTPDVVQFHRGNREGVLTSKQECEWIKELRGEGVDLVFCPSSPHFCELPVIVGLQPREYVGGEWKLDRELFPSWGHCTLPFNSRHYEMDAIGDFLPLMGLERPALKLYYSVSEKVRVRMAQRVLGVGCRVPEDGGRRSEVGGQSVTSATPSPRGRLPLRDDATFNLQPSTCHVGDSVAKWPLAATRRRGNLHSSTRHLALIFPGSGWPGKNWPPERFAALADWLAADKGMRIGLGGAPGERDLCERVASRMEQPATVWAGQLTLEESVALIEQSALVIGNDSAPIHMAAALDVPTVSFWGPTFPEKWAPNGPQHLVLKAENCAGCTYWHPRARCKGRPGCMEQIELESVQSLIEEREKRGITLL